MYALVLVLLCGCACALSGDADVVVTNRAPYYKQANDAYQKMVKDLEDVILSMRDNIPSLDDPRRHHAIIFNAINHEAIVQSNYGHKDYDDDYLENVNESVAEAISDPEKVIHAVEFLSAVDLYTGEISKLIDTCSGTEDECDANIDKIIKDNQEKDLSYAAEVLLLAGQAANHLNEQDALYFFIADNLDAFNFVLNAKDIIKEPVLSLAELYRYILFRPTGVAK